MGRKTGGSSPSSNASSSKPSSSGRARETLLSQNPSMLAQGLITFESLGFATAPSPAASSSSPSPSPSPSPSLPSSSSLPSSVPVSPLRGPTGAAAAGGGGDVAGFIPTTGSFSSLLLDAGGSSGSTAATSIAQEFQLAFTKLSKKDETTKLKALQEIAQLARSQDPDQVVAILPLWAKMYPKTLLSLDRRVRQACNDTFRELITATKKRFAPFLRLTVPALVCSMFDSFKEVAKSAHDAFGATFSPAKQLEVLAFCKLDILAFVASNLVSQKPETLCDPSKVSPEDMAAIYERVVTSSMLGLVHVVESLSSAQQFAPAELGTLLGDPKLTRFATHANAAVRSAFFALLTSIVQHCSDCTAQHMAVIAPLLLSGIGDTDPQTHAPVWNGILLLGKNHASSCWSHVSLRKSFLPKLYSHISNAGFGSGKQSYSCLLPLLSCFPFAAPELDAALFVQDLFDKLLQGRMSAKLYGCEAELWRSFFECLQYLAAASSVAEEKLARPEFKEHIVCGQIAKCLSLFFTQASSDAALNALAEALSQFIAQLAFSQPDIAARASRSIGTTYLDHLAHAYAAEMSLFSLKPSAWGDGSVSTSDSHSSSQLLDRLDILLPGLFRAFAAHGYDASSQHHQAAAAVVVQAPLTILAPFLAKDKSQSLLFAPIALRVVFLVVSSSAVLLNPLALLRVATEQGDAPLLASDPRLPGLFGVPATSDLPVFTATVEAWFVSRVLLGGGAAPSELTLEVCDLLVKLASKIMAVCAYAASSREDAELSNAVNTTWTRLVDPLCTKIVAELATPGSTSESDLALLLGKSLLSLLALTNSYVAAHAYFVQKQQRSSDAAAATNIAPRAVVLSTPELTRLSECILKSLLARSQSPALWSSILIQSIGGASGAGWRVAYLSSLDVSAVCGTIAQSLSQHHTLAPAVQRQLFSVLSAVLELPVAVWAADTASAERLLSLLASAALKSFVKDLQCELAAASASTTAPAATSANDGLDSAPAKRKQQQQQQPSSSSLDTLLQHTYGLDDGAEANLSLLAFGNKPIDGGPVATRVRDFVSQLFAPPSSSSAPTQCAPKPLSLTALDAWSQCMSALNGSPLLASVTGSGSSNAGLEAFWTAIAQSFLKDALDALVELFATHSGHSLLSLNNALCQLLLHFLLVPVRAHLGGKPGVFMSFVVERAAALMSDHNAALGPHLYRPVFAWLTGSLPWFHSPLGTNSGSVSLLNETAMSDETAASARSLSALVVLSSTLLEFIAGLFADADAGKSPQARLALVDVPREVQKLLAPFDGQDWLTSSRASRAWVDALVSSHALLHSVLEISPFSGQANVTSTLERVMQHDVWLGAFGLTTLLEAAAFSSGRTLHRLAALHGNFSQACVLRYVDDLETVVRASHLLLPATKSAAHLSCARADALAQSEGYAVLASCLLRSQPSSRVPALLAALANRKLVESSMSAVKLAFLGRTLAFLSEQRLASTAPCDVAVRDALLALVRNLAEATVARQDSVLHGAAPEGLALAASASNAKHVSPESGAAPLLHLLSVAARALVSLAGAPSLVDRVAKSLADVLKVVRKWYSASMRDSVLSGSFEGSIPAVVAAHTAVAEFLQTAVLVESSNIRAGGAIQLQVVADAGAWNFAIWQAQSWLSVLGASGVGGKASKPSKAAGASGSAGTGSSTSQISSFLAETALACLYNAVLSLSSTLMHALSVDVADVEDLLGESTLEAYQAFLYDTTTLCWPVFLEDASFFVAKQLPGLPAPKFGEAQAAPQRGNGPSTSRPCASPTGLLKHCLMSSLVGVVHFASDDAKYFSKLCTLLTAHHDGVQRVSFEMLQLTLRFASLEQLEQFSTLSVGTSASHHARSAAAVRVPAPGLPVSEHSSSGGGALSSPSASSASLAADAPVKRTPPTPLLDIILSSAGVELTLDERDAHWRLGFMLAWFLVFQTFHKVDQQTRAEYASVFKEKDAVSEIMTVLFCHIDLASDTVEESLLESVRDCSGSTVHLGRASAQASLHLLASQLFFRALEIVPALVRSWWHQCERNVAQLVDRFTQRHVSPLLIQIEVEAANQITSPGPGGKPRPEDAFSGTQLTIKGSTVSREVVASYKIDETSVDLTIRMASNHPLTLVDVEWSRRVGVSEALWRKWILQMTAFLTSQNGRIADALMLWKANADKHFEGLDDCPICYSVINSVNYSLPTLKCKTCKNKFHPTCLYKWFSTSGNSSCPLCRNLF